MQLTAADEFFLKKLSTLFKLRKTLYREKSYSINKNIVLPHVEIRRLPYSYSFKCQFFTNSSIWFYPNLSSPDQLPVSIHAHLNCMSVCTYLPSSYASFSFKSCSSTQPQWDWRKRKKHRQTDRQTDRQGWIDIYVDRGNKNMAHFLPVSQILWILNGFFWTFL